LNQSARFPRVQHSGALWGNFDGYKLGRVGAAFDGIE
jgi:hypothetical protein